MTTVVQLLGPSTGGIRRHVAALTASLRRRGWDVRVAGPAGVLDGLDVSLDAELPVVRRREPRTWVRARRALREATAGADVVHAHGLTVGWLSAVARPRRSARPGTVVTVHNVVLDETAGRAAAILRRLERALPARVDAVIATSGAVAARLAAGERVRVVPPLGPAPVVHRSAADVRERFGVDPARPLVVTVARLHPQKDLATLIEAAGFVAKEVPGAMVALVGEGPAEAALRARAGELGLGDTVVFAGPSANAADELAAADVVAISSRWESGPLVAAEALALGRPLVSTPVGFVPDLVVDGQSGRLVPIGDASALARAVGGLLSDPGAAAAMGEAGRRRVGEVLDPARLVDDVEDVYRAVLAGRP